MEDDSHNKLGRGMDKEIEGAIKEVKGDIRGDSSREEEGGVVMMTG